MWNFPRRAVLIPPRRFGNGPYDLTRRARDQGPAFAGCNSAEADNYASTEAYLSSLDADTTVFLRPEGPPKAPFFARAYTSLMVRDVFGGAPDERKLGDDYFAPLPVDIPMPRASDVAATAKLLAGAKRPVLVIGSQATLVVPKIQELRAAVEGLGIPTFLGGMSRGLLGRAGALHVRQGRGNALSDADFVLLLGAVADFRLSYGRSLPKGAAIVAVNRESASLYLNHGLFWKARVASQSDPCEFLLALATMASGQDSTRFAPWLASLKEKEAAKDAANRAKGSERAVGRGDLAGEALANPLSLLASVEAALPDNSILVADGGDFVATASYVLRPRGPLCWLDPGAYGTLGVGGGFALGAALVRPDAEVWIVWDGSAGYSIAEYDTFTRHGVNVIGVVGNDACWTQIEREQLPMLDRLLLARSRTARTMKSPEGTAARAF